MNEPKILVGKPEAADLLGISQRTLDRLVAAGQLGVRRVGRRVLFERAALEAFGRQEDRTPVARPDAQAEGTA